MGPEIDYRLFELVATNLSFADTARQLNLSPAVVTKRIAALENRLGVRLLTRTTRSCRLTDDGAAFLNRCRDILALMNETLEEMRARTTSPSGALRVVVPISFGRNHVAPLVAEFRRAYPSVTIQLFFSDGGDDLLAREFDLAIRIGLPTRGDFVVRRLLSARRAVCAAPCYLQAHGIPETPTDLTRHQCIVLLRDLLPLDHWMFEQGGIMETVRVNAVLASNNGEVTQRWIGEGLGIGLKSLWDIKDDLEEGRLIELFPGLCAERGDIFVVYPDRNNLPARVRLFVDLLATRLGTGVSVNNSCL